MQCRHPPCRRPNHIGLPRCETWCCATFTCRSVECRPWSDTMTPDLGFSNVSSDHGTRTPRRPEDEVLSGVNFADLSAKEPAECVGAGQGAGAGGVLELVETVP
jgi:hypothetical protein